jgi:hypothetical protein
MKLMGISCPLVKITQVAGKQLPIKSDAVHLSRDSDKTGSAPVSDRGRELGGKAT